MAEHDIDVDRVIEEMNAVPQTRERRMIRALAHEVKALKDAGGDSKKSARQKKAAASGGAEGGNG